MAKKKKSKVAVAEHTVEFKTSHMDTATQINKHLKAAGAGVRVTVDLDVKPCLHCDQKMDILEAMENVDRTKDGLRIVCRNCGAAGPDWLCSEMRGCRNGEEALAAWNGGHARALLPAQVPVSKKPDNPKPGDKSEDGTQEFGKDKRWHNLSDICFRDKDGLLTGSW